jgi:GTPase
MESKEEEPQKKLIFESLTEGWDKDYDKNEIPPYIKEIRLAVIGNVDSGKSTLVGCLTKGIKDDGRGYARKFVFNYQHENDSGRTSSIAEEIIGFRNKKMIYSPRPNEKKNVAWKDIASQSDHVITLLDLCGHEKYLKTTMYGVSALLPHYAVILIGTNMGVQRMTKEHLGIVISLNIPFFIVFTKIDIAPKEVKEKTINTFTSLLKTGLQKSVFNVKSEQDAEFAAKNIPLGNIVPIFQVSTVSGEGLDDLKSFLAQLVPKNLINAELSLIKTAKDKVEVLLDNAFNTKFGCIHAGVVIAGKIAVNQKLLIGPTQDGLFKPVQIREIQFLRVSVNEVCCGNSCSFRLKSLDKNFELSTANFKKGMVLLDPEIKLEPTLEFEVEALIVHHQATIKVGYQSVVHCHVVRQTCTIVAMDKEYLRSGDKGIIRFKFIKKPEYLHVGDTILFREGRTRGKGKILKIFPIDIKEMEKEKNINQSKKSKKAEIHNKNNKENTNTNDNNNANTNTQSKKSRKFHRYKNKDNKDKQNNDNKDKQNENNTNKNSGDKNPPPKKNEG